MKNQLAQIAIPIQWTINAGLFAARRVSLTKHHHRARGQKGLTKQYSCDFLKLSFRISGEELLLIKQALDHARKNLFLPDTNRRIMSENVPYSDCEWQNPKEYKTMVYDKYRNPARAPKAHLRTCDSLNRSSILTTSSMVSWSIDRDLLKAGVCFLLNICCKSF